MTESRRRFILTDSVNSDIIREKIVCQFTFTIKSSGSGPYKVACVTFIERCCSSGKPCLTLLTRKVLEAVA